MGDTGSEREWMLEQIHIDVARNATDDFNPFHDSHKYDRIRGNPFRGTIALGFQLECLVEYLVTRLRESEGQDAGLAFRNYQFSFAGALRPGVTFRVLVKPTASGRHADGSPLRVNRVALRTGRGLLMLGHVRDSTVPLAEIGEPPRIPDAAGLPDRSLLPDGDWFHKRKFMANSNAKNLVAGSLADQWYYFDELEDRVRFPDLFPASLISCALLEQACARGHDFYAEPMVYTSHHISVDRTRVDALRSADALQIVVSMPERMTGARGLRGVELTQQRHRCFGLLNDGGVLFRAEVLLAPLSAIAGAESGRAFRGTRDRQDPEAGTAPPAP